MADMYRDMTIGNYPQFPIIRNPSLWQRAVAAFKAQPTLTKSAVLSQMISPEEYNFQKNYYRHINEENPAETVWQKAAQLLGKGIAQATDPIGLLLAKGTTGIAQEATAGALSQIGESVADDVASGQKVDRTKAMATAIGGAVGAPLGGAIGGSHSGVLPEVLGRIGGATVVEPFISDKTGSAIADVLAAEQKKPKGQRIFSLKDADPWN